MWIDFPAETGVIDSHQTSPGKTRTLSNLHDANLLLISSKCNRKVEGVSKRTIYVAFGRYLGHGLQLMKNMVGLSL